MNPNRNRPQITPEMVQRFADYFLEHPSWGACHVSFGDGNYDMMDDPEWAEARGDTEGAALCRIGQELTPSQRGKLARRAEGRV